MSFSLLELQRIPTTGARAVQPFEVDGLELLAIPQLARDVPGQDAGMNVGDSDTELLLLHRVGGRYVPYSTLAAPGGEDAEFFAIDGRAFLAVASIRSGSGPYRFAVDSRIFEWVNGGFVPFQSLPTHAAKQWKHWSVGGRHFLGLAQGVELPGLDEPHRDSMVYEWDGSSFVEFQAIPSRFAYNWHPFRVGPAQFVAHAEHLGPSVLYRWDGDRLQHHQVLLERAGRSFTSFDADGGSYLVAAGLLDPPRVMRWDGDRFAEIGRLPGLGARELLTVRRDGRLFVVRVNFILGTPADPVPELLSQVYEWDGHAMHVVAEFSTCGGTDAAVVGGEGQLQLLVSNALSPQLRFAADTVVYALRAGEPR